MSDPQPALLSDERLAEIAARLPKGETWHYRHDIRALFAHIDALRLLITDLLDPCGDGSASAVRVYQHGQQEATARAVAWLRADAYRGIAADDSMMGMETEPEPHRVIAAALDAVASAIERGER